MMAFQVDRWVLVGLLAGLAGCVSESAGGAGGNGGTAGGGASGSAGQSGSGGAGVGGSSGSGGSAGSGGGADATPGCAPTITCMGNCVSAECQQGCYDRATEHGQALVSALAQCSSDNACENIDCTAQACPGEYGACVEDYGEGGTICFAAGSYVVCDIDLNCQTYPVQGGAWGSNEQYASIDALFDCTQHMQALITIAQIDNASADVGDSCAVTECHPH